MYGVRIRSQYNARMPTIDPSVLPGVLDFDGRLQRTFGRLVGAATLCPQALR
jgi:hypothetical protein